MSTRDTPIDRRADARSDTTEFGKESEWVVTKSYLSACDVHADASVLFALRMRARICWIKVMFKIYLDELSKRGDAGWKR